MAVSTKSVKAAVPVRVAKPFKGLSRAVKPAAKLSNVSKATDMMVWTPIDNKMFETFSFLPPLDNRQISRQIDYIVANGWTPCLEFASADDAYIASRSPVRFGGSAAPNYYDNRYWTMWKLPMFGCTDPGQVLNEIEACTRAFGNSYIRLVAFDNIMQVQVSSFLVHRPHNASEYTQVDKRSVR